MGDAAARPICIRLIEDPVPDRMSVPAPSLVNSVPAFVASDTEPDSSSVPPAPTLTTLSPDVNRIAGLTVAVPDVMPEAVRPLAVIDPSAFTVPAAVNVRPFTFRVVAFCRSSTPVFESVVPAL